MHKNYITFTVHRAYSLEATGGVERLPNLIVGSQHISMTYGHWLNALMEAGKLLNLEVLHL